MQTAAFAQRQRVDRQSDAVSLDRNVADLQTEAAHVQIREIDAVLARLHIELAMPEIHVPDRYAGGMKPEFSFLFPFLLALDSLQYLSQIARPGAVLHQIETDVLEAHTAERHGPGKDIQALQGHNDPPRVQQRVAMVILHIEAVERHPAEQLQMQLVDRDDRLQLVAQKTGGSAAREILYPRQIEQQRQRHRQNDQRKNRRRDERSYYFYNFAHRSHLPRHKTRNASGTEFRKRPCRREGTSLVNIGQIIKPKWT